MSTLSLEFKGSKLQTEFHDNHVVHQLRTSTGVLQESIWTQEKIIGSGAFGEVWLEKDISGKLRAVKKLRRQPTAKKMDFTQELLAFIKLKNYTHLFLDFFGWYGNEEHVFLAMEYIEHGDLGAYMKGPEAKNEVKEITSQILEGLEVLHKKEICHRDLKPGNILIASTRPIWVKIADFGISKWTKDTFLRTTCGTEGYIAPELLGALSQRPLKRQPKRPGYKRRGTFTHALDIWSLGCLVYEILTSNKPFFDTGDDNDETTTTISTLQVDSTFQPRIDMGSLVSYCKGDIEFPTETLRKSKISEEGIDFVKSLLIPNPDDRPTAALALKNSWLRSYKCNWFEKLRNEFLSLGVELDLGDKENILIRQIGKADIIKLLPPPEKGGISDLLLQAAANGYNLVISKLFESPSLEPVDSLTRGKLFQLAIEAGQLDTIKLLLHYGADVNAQIDNQTVLQWAVKTGHLDIAIVLLESKADFSISPDFQQAFRSAAEVVRMADTTSITEDEGYRTNLETLSEHKDIDIIRLLLTSKADVITTAEDREQTALEAAAGAGHFEVVKFLLDNRADVNATSRSGRTPLQAAAENGHTDIVKLLLDNGADSSTRSAQTALLVASENGHIDIAKLLLVGGVDANAFIAEWNSQTALLSAAENGHIDITKLLLDYGACVDAETGGRTALQAASEAGHIGVIKLLLEKKANVNAAPLGPKGRTALQAASGAGHIGIVTLLLDNNADVNAAAAEVEGQTALQAAAKGGHIEIVRLLLVNGADVNSKSGEHTALSSAMIGGHQDIVRVLQDALNSAFPDNILFSVTSAGW